MRSRGWTTVTGTDRGVSELAGYVLLVGIVIAGAMTIMVVATPLMSDSQDHQEDETSELAMEEVSARLTSLSASGGSAATEFRLLENQQQTHNEPELVTNQGYINVTINENSTCSVNTSLDSIRVETETGDTLVYEAGGVWRQSSDGGVVSVTPPAFSIQDGHVDIDLANLTGSVSGGSTEALLNATTSNQDSRNAIDTLYQGDCKRPDNITVEIKSDLHEGWAEHLKESGGYTNLTVDRSNGTTTAFLAQSALPPVTNDAVNNVVNLTNASYMSNVTVSQNGIAVSKNASNNYTVYVQPVADDVGIGTMRNVSASGNVTRDPLDLVFVIDESGSMTDSPPDTSLDKYEVARNAMQNFTTYLNPGYDRVGLVGFQEVSWNAYAANVYRTNDRSLTPDLSQFNSTVTNTGHSGGTFTAIGMKRAHSILSLQSNETRDKYIIMLSDGENTGTQEIYVGGTRYTDPDPATERIATLANRSRTTVHTIGFANNAGNLNEPFLTQTAANGGGNYYYAENASALEDAFELIGKRISSTQQVARTPFSTNLSANGSVQTPQITGNVSNLANVTRNNNTFLNVNDPTAPSTFSHAFSISDGGMVNFSATVYGCDQWVTTGRSQTINGSNYPVTRCKIMNASKNTTVSGSNVTVYTNADSTAFTTMLANTRTADWQANLTDLVVNRSLYNATTDQLTLDSNQALVLYDFPDGKNTDNRMLTLYTIGQSDEMRPANVVDISISNIELQRD
ncbi:vWA domain-containing protein [Halorhabdus amylolytica]|uniref:vWA domain-containing protein n=1 Tax=Halorhabdus amylolytica TaxID=2559573 RepID=UPI0010AA7F3A|nr:VWA domain-containing protein [Halorhabdus amylolytica]